MIEKGENFDLLSVNDRRKHVKSIYFDKTNMYGKIKAIRITSGANIFWYVFGDIKMGTWESSFFCSFSLLCLITSVS